MLFDEMPERYMVSFVTLIQGYNQRFRSYDAIWLFSRFHGEGHELNPFVFSTVLKLLVIAEWTESGFGVHACVCKLAPLWMRIVGFKPNNFIFASMLKACVGLEVFDAGKAVHGHAFKTSYVEELFFGAELMDLYIKSGDVDDALRVFDEMPKGDVIPWSFMIAQYARSEHSEETIVLFCKMRQGLVLPNQITLASLLQAFAILVDLQFGKQIHYHIVKAGNGNKALSLFKDMLECQVQGSEVTYSSVLQACSDMYAKCGSIRDACLSFNMLRECNQVSWSAMIAGYSVHGLCREALKAFELMQETECKPDKCLCRSYDVELGRISARRVLEIEPEDEATYALLSNIYANARKTHFTFSHKMIKGMLKWLYVKARNEGHVPDCSSVLLDVDDVDKERWLWVHSERLALAYDLIRTPSLCHVHIIKNLRICAGSHTAIK
uniref:DYW domain-containing protein n=2 Tax=Populus TaxID=3689 RepID=A0A4U5NNL7_POPAL|nr:hypothetical protein D5086_0000255940 [Populus alba]